MNNGAGKVDAARLPPLLPGPGHFQGPASTYDVVSVTFTPDITGAAVPRARDIVKEATGTHLHVLEIIGSDQLAVAFGRRGKFVPIQEGDTLTRAFDRFIVRQLGSVVDQTDTSVLPTGFCQVTFLVSTGEMRVPRFKPYGFSEGFRPFVVTVPVAGKTIYQLIRAWMVSMNAVSPTRGMPVFMKYGGTVLIRNLDNAASLFLYTAQGDTVAFDTNPLSFGPDTQNGAWEILPLEVLTLTFEGRMTNNVRGWKSGVLGKADAALASSAGNIRANLMFSRFVIDGTDDEARITFPTPFSAGTP